MLTAAIFRGDGSVRSIGRASPDHLNVDLRAGETWREIPPSCATSRDVPPLETLPPHPALVEPA